MINVLKFPKTKEYSQLKSFLFSKDCPYCYHSTTTPFSKSGYSNISMYMHQIIKRPEESEFNVPEVLSDLAQISIPVCQKILDYNEIDFSSFLRMCVNVTSSCDKILKSVPHVDHYYDHKNLIIYFSSTGGRTFVGNESYDPVEDSAITFNSETHYQETPKSGRRIVLVATYI